MWEYLKPASETGDGRREKRHPARGARPKRVPSPDSRLPAIDRTYKMFIGGKQARPDAPYPRAIVAPDGRRLAEGGEGNRKDVRNAVEAARAGGGWGHTTGHTPGANLYYIAGNLPTPPDEVAAALDAVAS